MPKFDRLSASNIFHHMLSALFCAFIYFYTYKLNVFLFDDLKFSEGISWVFIPMGLRVLLVLIFVETGALGVFIGSLFFYYLNGSQDDHVFNIVSGLISAGAPLLARYIAVDNFKLDINLSQITLKPLLEITAIFALITALFRSMWLYWYGKSDAFIEGAFVMFVGNFIGALMVLSTAAVALKIYRSATEKL